MSNNAIELRNTWNKLLLSSGIDVCTEKLKGCGVTDLKVLKLIYLNPNYKIKDFLSILNIPNSSMTNIINRLSKKELIRRKMNSRDLRSFELELSEMGKEAVVEHLEAEAMIFEKLLSNLNDDEIETFVRLFQKIASSIE